MTETVQDRDQEFVVHHQGLKVLDREGGERVVIDPSEPFDQHALQLIQEEIRRLVPLPASAM